LDYAYVGLAVFDQVLVNAANGVITANSIGIGMSDASSVFLSSVDNSGNGRSPSTASRSGRRPKGIGYS
jgi:hypothetical protein